MKPSQIIVCVITVIAITLLWLLGSQERITIRVLQTLVLSIAGYMLATATKIEKVK